MLKFVEAKIVYKVYQINNIDVIRLNSSWTLFCNVKLRLFSPIIYIKNFIVYFKFKFSLLLCNFPSYIYIQYPIISSFQRKNNLIVVGEFPIRNHHLRINWSGPEQWNITRKWTAINSCMCQNRALQQNHIQVNNVFIGDDETYWIDTQEIF